MMEPREGWGPLRGVHSTLVAGRTGARMSKILLMFPQVAPSAIIIPRSGTAGQGQVGHKEYNAVEDKWMAS